ncbi:MAG: response regulator [Desulfuromonadales bacterium]|nr:response regulator [Desulfuromonadales bacterium]
MKEKTILIVDDSPSVRAILGDMLKDEGYNVVEATNGQEGFKLAEYVQFDMIITDLSMPVMDGIEFLKKAKNLPLTKFVPMVVLTSENDTDKLAEAKAAGAATNLSKPFRENQLKAMLKLIFGC